MVILERLNKVLNYNETLNTRKYTTHDIAKRLGTITPDRLFINGFPTRHPIAVFNPALIPNGETIKLFPRIIVGYYKYVSAIVEAYVPLEDILTGNVNINMYSSNLAITPSNEFDLWGAEDPRAYFIDDHKLITYTGRTISYFFPIGEDKTLPITAVKQGDQWRKILIHKPSETLEGEMNNDKNAFILKHYNKYYLFHRPQLENNIHFTMISELPGEDIENATANPRALHEIRPIEDWIAIPPAAFEEKIAWGPPPIHLTGDKYIFLLHGVGTKLQVYRVFAAIIEIPKNEPPIIEAVTPAYIMEPKTPYETYGDRPYAVFPCGITKYKNELLISYGAADYMVAFADINLDELLSELDKGRLS